VRWLARSDGWFGGENVVHPANAPSATQCAPYLSGGQFQTSDARAVTWSAGFAVTAIGLNAQAQTGYDTTAQITYSYGENGVACGTNDGPYQAAQVVAKKLSYTLVRRNRVLVALIPVAAAAAILGYIFIPGSSSLGNGPLGPPGNPDIACLPASPGQTDTEGLQNPTNNSHDTLVIDHVALASPQNITLVGAYIVPGTGIVGAWRGFPPPAGQLAKDVSLARWRPAIGARVLPGETIDVVVGLAPTSHATASTAGVEVFYHDGSTDYEWVCRLRVIIKVAPATCSLS
jgi:hypothetical protein